MRTRALQVITWATILGAIACAGWLALITPAHTFVDADRDASVGVALDVVDASFDGEPSAAGPAASAPLAPASPSPRASF